MASKTEITGSYEAAKTLLGVLIEWGAGRQEFHGYEYHEDEPENPWWKLQFENIEWLHAQQIPSLMKQIGKILHEVPDSFVNGWIYVPAGSRNYLDAAHRLGQKVSLAAKCAIEECYERRSEEPLESFRDTLCLWIQPEPELLRTVKKDLDYECDCVLANCSQSTEESSEPVILQCNVSSRVVWNADDLELLLDGELVYRFRMLGDPAKQILKTFQENAWRERVLLGKIYPERVKEALKTLNKRLKPLTFSRSKGERNCILLSLSE